MSDYRRAYIPGGTNFFTVKSFEARPVLTQTAVRAALRQAIYEIRETLPFENLAWVLLPNHLHTIWRLPERDSDFSLRWSRIKQGVTKRCGELIGAAELSQSRQATRRGSDLATPLWEHLIRDDTDFERHVDYIHYNPVKHGYVARVADWPYRVFIVTFAKEFIPPIGRVLTKKNKSHLANKMVRKPHPRQIIPRQFLRMDKTRTSY